MMLRPLLMVGLLAAPALPADPVFEQAVRPLVTRHCATCHGAKLKTANLNLETTGPGESAVWQEVGEKLRRGLMPPPGLPRPRPEEIRAATAWIDAHAAESDRKPDPGRVTARRLNKFEYNATVQDLLAVDFRPADDFPADDSGYGFDNIGDVLSLSPVLMEKYLAAAEKIARRAIQADPPPKPTIERYKSDLQNVLEPTHRFPLDAEYEFRTGLGGKRPEGVPVTMVRVALFLDGRQVKLFEREVPRDKPRLFQVRLPVKAGERRLKVLPVGQTPETYVDFLEVRGPFVTAPPEPPESHWRVFVCGHANGQHQPECGRQILTNLARRAWRRPVRDGEVDKLLALVDLARQQGESFEQGIRVALQAILVSPHFLFRIERDAGPGVHRISDLELGSRLSYFLWSSLPDEELVHVALEGALGRREALEAQVRRMLADPRSRRLVENFAGQWLELRNLESIKPDPQRFPEFDEALRASMRRETELFFENIVRQDRPILDFIDAPYTFLNERLARHYGIAGVTGPEFRLVKLDGGQRGGILTQASVLTVTSYPTRTSPVLRGKWLLENVLNAPPPPPPPDAGALDESQVNVAGTVREQFEKHRSQPACAACHVRMDPLGFGFENYDAIGRWRTHEGKFRVDASGTLPGGQAFNGAGELKAILRNEKEAFGRCLTEKMLTYALGRGLERYDRPAVEEICRKLAQNEYRFSSLILGIVESLPFQARRGEVPAGTKVAARPAGPPGGEP